MFYRIAADAMSAIHLTLMLFVVFGQLAVVLGILCRWRWIRNPWFRWIHMAIILTVAVEAVLVIDCPLTDWERGLRRLAEESSDERSFTARLLHWLLFPDVSMDLLFKCYIAFAVLVLVTFVLAPPWIRAPRGHVVLKLKCAGGTTAPAGEQSRETRPGYAVTELALDRPPGGACTKTIICPICEQKVGIEVRSRRRFALRAILLALLGLAVACVGFFWAYLDLPTSESPVVHKVWENTVTVVGLVIFVLAPSGLLIRKALVATDPSATPANGRHRLSA